MNIIICVKQVVDPEAPPSAFKVDTAANRMVPGPGVAPVVSPFDEYAVEAAMRIKDKEPAKITILSLGFNLVREVVKKPLAMGADQLILLDDEAFAGGDSYSTAYALAMAIKKIGSYDLILCGRQASDWDAGLVGSGIAEILGIPSVTIAKKIDVAGGKATVERVVSDGYEGVETPLPALITVSNELGQARYPTIKGIMAAKKIDPVVWKPADIGVNPAQIGAAGRQTSLLKLFQPVREGKCEVIGGQTPEEAGANLAVKLREAGLL
jgi:electron transfer flavoprotein beta subunit